ncbi:MAG: hypothetical protein LC732_08100 [Acidobacteria bacterium]|nr:hypothetical protein [Acidobacteriota bacterium]
MTGKNTLQVSLAIFLIAGAAFAQHPPATGTQGAAPAGMNCQMMMDHMHAKQKAMDEKLQPLVARMNAATGQARVDATAAVVNELVAQRHQAREQMMTMMPRMMNHMMEHMQGGMMSGMREGMMACPMMKSQDGAQQAAPEHEH